MIKFKTSFIIEEKPKGSNHRMFKLISKLPSILQAEIDYGLICSYGYMDSWDELVNCCMIIDGGTVTC